MYIYKRVYGFVTINFPLLSPQVSERQQSERCSCNVSTGVGRWCTRVLEAVVVVVVLAVCFIHLLRMTYLLFITVCLYFLFFFFLAFGGGCQSVFCAWWRCQFF